MSEMNILEGDTIVLDFSKVPERIPDVEPGTYNAMIESASAGPSNNDPTRISAMIRLRITAPEGNSQVGRKITDFITLTSDTDSPSMVRLGNLLDSAGIAREAGGVKLTTLVGKTVKIVTTQSAGVDKKTGETRMYTNVKAYLK